MTTQTQWRKEIDIGDGAGIQVFEADTQEELVNKLADAQLNASKKIRELNKELKTYVKPDPQPEIKQYKAEELTPEKQTELTLQLANEKEAEKARKEAEITAAEWGDENLQFKRSRENIRQMFGYIDEKTNEFVPGYMAKNNMAITKRNMTLAFEALKSDGLLEFEPEVKQEPKEEDKTTSRIEERPRGSQSSGLRASQASGMPVSPKPKYTWEEIRGMSAETYKQNLSNPEFRRIVDSMPKAAAR